MGIKVSIWCGIYAQTNIKLKIFVKQTKSFLLPKKAIKNANFGSGVCTTTEIVPRKFSDKKNMVNYDIRIFVRLIYIFAYLT